MTYRLAHKIIKPAKPYTPMVATDITRTIREAKKTGPLVGPVVVTVLPPLDLLHPMNSRFALQHRAEAQQRLLAGHQGRK